MIDPEKLQVIVICERHDYFINWIRRNNLIIAYFHHCSPTNPEALRAIDHANAVVIPIGERTRAIHVLLDIAQDHGYKVITQPNDLRTWLKMPEAKNPHSYNMDQQQADTWNYLNNLLKAHKLHF